ncbi:hypothetical protein [Xanthomonas vasicola]|nr:hypothetical protein [Xanthomonas vasicola]
MAARSGQSHGSPIAPEARTGQRVRPRKRDYAVAPVTRWGLVVWL